MGFIYVLGWFWRKRETIWNKKFALNIDIANPNSFRFKNSDFLKMCLIKKSKKIKITPVANVYGVAINVQSPICHGHNVQIYVYNNNEIQ